jgi:hypothetical protein
MAGWYLSEQARQAVQAARALPVNASTPRRCCAPTTAPRRPPPRPSPDPTPPSGSPRAGLPHRHPGARPLRGHRAPGRRHAVGGPRWRAASAGRRLRPGRRAAGHPAVDRQADPAADTPSASHPTCSADSTGGSAPSRWGTRSAGATVTPRRPGQSPSEPCAGPWRSDRPCRPGRLNHWCGCRSGSVSQSAPIITTGLRSCLPCSTLNLRSRRRHADGARPRSVVPAMSWEASPRTNQCSGSPMTASQTPRPRGPRLPGDVGERVGGDDERLRVPDPRATLGLVDRQAATCL